MANTIRIKRGTTEPTAGALVTGELAINTADGNLYSKLDDGTVSNVIAKTRKLTATVRNESGTTIDAFRAVYINGASGNKATVVLAQANSEATSSKTFAVTATSIANNNNGEVIVSGLLEKVDTSSFAAGDALWLSPSTAGGFTTTRPTAPDNAVFIGVVTRSHLTQGEVEIKIQNGYEIEELHNVLITTPSNGQVLTYNSSTSIWYNAAPSGGGGGGTWGSITGTVTDQTDLTTYISGLGYQTSSDVSTYVTGLGYLTDAPSDGSEYVRKDGAWAVATGGGGGGAAAIPVYDNGVTYSLGNQVIFSDRFWYMSNYVGAAGYDPIGYPAYWTEISPYVDTGLTDAPSDGTQYVRQNGSWVANSGFTFGDAPSDGNFYVRYSGNWQQIGAGSDSIATQSYVTSQGYATTGDVSTAVTGLVTTTNARLNALVESFRATINDAGIFVDGSGYLNIPFNTGAFNICVNTSQFSSSGKWFGILEPVSASFISPATSVSLSSGVVTMIFAYGSVWTGSGIYYTEDGGTTWVESTFKLS